MSFGRALLLALLLAVAVIAAPVLGFYFLNETFLHGFAVTFSDGYPRSAADEAACAADWTAGLPYLMGFLGVLGGAAYAVRQFARRPRLA